MVSFNRRCTLGLLAAPFAFSFAPGQALAAAKTPISVRLGWDLLVDGDARDFTKSSGLALGLSYDIQKTPLTSGMSRIDLDYMRHSGHGNKIEKEQLFYTFRKGFSKAKRIVGMPYAGIGIGLARVKGRVRVPVTGGTGGSGGSSSTTGGSSNTGGSSYVPPQTAQTAALIPLQTTGFITQSTSKTRVVLKALLGYELPSGFYTEATYTFSGKLQGVRTDSFNISLGVHF